MIDKKLVENYKKLEKYDIEHLMQYAALRYCYDYEKSVDDDMANIIATLAYDCWKDDYYNKDINDYTGFILDGVYDYGATLEQVQLLDSDYIIRCFNDDKSAEDILKIDTEEMNYCFTTFDNLKYYSSLDREILCIANEKGYKVGETNIMDYAPDIFFDLLTSNKIKDISMYMHHAIRTIIKEDGLLEDEEYSESIKCYEKYCEANFVNSKTILNEVGLDTDIDIFDLDKLTIEELKKKKLYKVLDDNNEIISSNYSYIASIDNGNDYYYNNKDEIYVVVDKENGVKELKNAPFFILNKLSKEENYIYINDSEIEKVITDLSKEDYYDDSFNILSYGKFKIYVDTHYPRYSQTISDLYSNQIKAIFNSINKIESERIGKQIKQSREIKKKMKDFEL